MSWSFLPLKSRVSSDADMLPSVNGPNLTWSPSAIGPFGPLGSQPFDA